MLVNIHILQNYAPSNLNRDDTGAPKDTIFGGVLRARTSSQSLKRSIRRSETFRNGFTEQGLLARRTRLFPRLLHDYLVQRGLDAGAVQAITRRAVEFGRESGRGRAEDGGGGAAAEPGVQSESSVPQAAPASLAELQTKQLIFLSDAELAALAEKLVALYTRQGEKAFAKMKIDEIAREMAAEMPRSVDIAMFGRMTTSAAFVNVEAAVQVAHAISTHRVEQEFDYYTAVDDISGESGAGFIGDTPYNSATYYKYFSVHWESLVQNLGGDAETARQAALALLRAACLAHPSGKQNSFAAHNLPDLVLVEVRAQNVPVSYANAFQKPVRQSAQQSLIEASAAALAEYRQKLTAMYNLPAESAFASTLDEQQPGARACASLDALVAWLGEHLAVPVGTGPAPEGQR